MVKKVKVLLWEARTEIIGGLAVVAIVTIVSWAVNLGMGEEEQVVATPASVQDRDSGDSIDVQGDVSGSTIIQSGGGDVNIEPAQTEEAFEEELDHVDVEGKDENVLVAYNRRGFPVWRKPFETRIVKALADDLNDDGEVEVILGLGVPGSRPGWFIILDARGSVIDEYNTWESPIYIGGAKQESRIVDYQIADLHGDGRKRIVAISSDTYWYASKVSVLEYKDGKLRQTAHYWNPGSLYTLDVLDLNNDEVQEMVITGVNNDLQAVTSLDGNVHIAFLLRADRLIGQAPPWFGQAQRGSEVWYGFVTPRSTRITLVDFEDLNGDNILDVHLGLSDGCSFYLDMSGKIIGEGHGSACREESDLYILEVEQ